MSFLQPRLGPKPFTPPKLNETETFDKVFNVPVAPGNHTNGVHIEIETTNQETQELKDEKVEDVNNETVNEDDKVDVPKEETDNNGCVEVEEEYIPKTPSTAERRKIFEVNTNKENENDDVLLDVSDGNNFERASTQRNSIAERRKMYERSQSVQEPAVPIVEKPDGSPVMLRRKDSFKNRKCPEVLKEENSKKVMLKQQSLDPQAIKKQEPISTPTPKRTSTVFGMLIS